MATIKLISALRLLKQFGDSPEVVSVIDATLNELERLYKIEAELIALREQSAPDPSTSSGYDPADWQAQNRMVSR